MNSYSPLLTELGFIFPANEKQVEGFERVQHDFVNEGNEKSINPKRILRRIREETVKLSNTDYHKRLTLAAEIVYQLNEDPYMGHLKLEKMIYLCKNVKVFPSILISLSKQWDLMILL